MVGSTQPVKWKQQDDALVIEPFKNYPSANAVVYKIEFAK